LHIVVVLHRILVCAVVFTLPPRHAMDIDPPSPRRAAAPATPDRAMPNAGPSGRPVEHKMPAPEYDDEEFDPCEEMYVKVCMAEDLGTEREYHTSYHEYDEDEEEEEYDPEYGAMCEAQEKAEKERRAAERALELVALNAIAASVARQRSDPKWRSKELEAIRAGVV